MISLVCVGVVTSLHTNYANNEKLYFVMGMISNKLCGRPPQYTPAPVTLTFDLLTLKVVSESRVTWATSVPINVLDLGPMYATDRQTDVRHHTASLLNAPA